MKCPNPTCGYQYGYDHENNVDVTGEEGEFFAMPICMERDTHDPYHPGTEKKALHACPKCGFVFILVD